MTVYSDYSDSALNDLLTYERESMASDLYRIERMQTRRRETLQEILEIRREMTRREMNNAVG